MSKLDVLLNTRFGERVAEDEIASLGDYFVETDPWRRVYSGEVDIVYGPKGSGKSAIYALLNSKEDELFDRSVIIAPAENVRGAPVFRDLVADPPTTEVEFMGLWKLYFATLLYSYVDSFGIKSDPASQLRTALAQEGLVAQDRNLATLLGSVGQYVRAALRPAALETGVQIDPVTGLPKGFSGKITFREPVGEASTGEYRSVDNLLALADQAFADEGLGVWILLDRLDVAFADNEQLEQNALRAVFKVYLDFLALPALHPKVFLRSDIWRRITTAGFREASHITRDLTIAWDRQSLLNLILRRVLRNESISDFYAVSPQDVLATAHAQQAFFDRMFPEQIDVGPNKSSTLDWMLGRCKDGLGYTAPRELIHLLNSVRDVQVRKIEAGEVEPDGEQLFSRPSFKQALQDVSRVRVEQTLFAEYPTLRPYLERMRGEKTKHSTQTLAALWECTPDEASEIAGDLVEVGFFEPQGPKGSPEYWVPFLFRDGLDLVQGTAEA